MSKNKFQLSAETFSSIYENTSEQITATNVQNLVLDIIDAMVIYPDLSAVTGYYTTGATITGNKAFFDRNDLLSAYTLDLSSFSGGSSSNLWSASTGANSIIANNGTGNLANGNFAIAGGNAGMALGNYSVVAGGYNNRAEAQSTFIGGGYHNSATTYYSIVVAGQNNLSSGVQSFIGGGLSNKASSTFSVVTGGRTNSATTAYGFIGNGQSNLISGNSYASIAGSVVVGGNNNIALDGFGGSCSFIGGGMNNFAGGGYYTFSFVGGGTGNKASGNYSTIVAGKNNTASGNYHSIVVGGSNNTSSAFHSFIGGGIDNIASGPGYSVIVGGNGNLASGNRAIIVGGGTNSATTTYTFIGGGYKNLVSGVYSSVVGGKINTVSGSYSSVLNGKSNTVTGNYSAIIGGSGSTANGNGTIVLGSDITGNTDNTVYANNIKSNLINSTIISATTYYGLPIDVYITGGTYSAGTATFSNNTGGTFNVTGFSTGGSGGTTTLNASQVAWGSDINTVTGSSQFNYTGETLSVTRTTTGTALYVENNSNSLGGGAPLVIKDGAYFTMGFGWNGGVPQSVQFDMDTNGLDLNLLNMGYGGNLQLTPKAGASIILNGLISTNGNQINLLADGVLSTDAVNKSQLPTVGTTAPASPSIGDLWVDTN